MPEFTHVRSSAPTSGTTLRAKPVPAIHYPVRLRIADWWAGHRDGGLDLTGLTSSPTGPIPTGSDLTGDTSEWLRHNEHHRDERCAHEQLAHQARTVDLAIRHQANTNDLAAATKERDAAHAALTAIPDLTDDALTRRGPAEVHAPEEVVRARRTREHTFRNLVPAQRRLQAAEDAIHRLTGELNESTAQIETLLQVTQTRQGRLHEYHHRRGSLYRRAYLRALRRQAQRETRRQARREARPVTRPSPVRRLTG